MGLLRRRPLAAVCFVFFSSFLSCAVSGIRATLLLLAVGLFSFILLLFLALRRRCVRRMLLLLFCVAAAAGASLFGLLRLHLYQAQAEEYGDRWLAISGTVVERREGEYGTTLLLEVEQIDGERVRGLILVEETGDEAAREGNTVSFGASLSAPSEWQGEEALFRLADGIFATTQNASALSVTGETDSPRLRLLSDFSVNRDSLADRLCEAVEGEGGHLMSAMLLGGRERLDPAVSRDFQRTGLTHILSISGFHLALLGGMALKLFRALGLRRRASYTAVAATVLLYMTLTGFPVSVVRAGVMMLLLCLGEILFRRSDGLTALAVAATLILLISPQAIYDYGFHLSVLATFGILVYTEWRRAHSPREKRPLWRRMLAGILDSLCVTLCAIGATLPLSALFFGELSLMSPISNLLVGPLLEGYLILSVPMLILGHVPLLSPFAAWLGEAILSLTAHLAEPRAAVISLNYLSVKILLFALLFTVLFLLLLSRVKWRAALAATVPQAIIITILLIFLQTFLFSQNAVSYTISDKNETLILYSEGRGLLCDYTDGSAECLTYAEEEAAYLRLTEYEGYLLSHYHEKHEESVPRILSRLKIRTLYLPTPQSETEERVYRALRAAAEEGGIDCIRYDENTPILLGNLTFIPHKPIRIREHADCAATVLFGDARLTYLGGAFRTEEEAARVREAVKSSTHLLFGRHGSLPNEPLPFFRFSADLSLLLIPETARLPAELRAMLTARGIPYRAQAEREYIPLS